MGRKKVQDVQTFMEELVHARKSDIETSRTLISKADKTLTERVKWNAPSFCSGGDDRITFRLQPGDRVELVFHRGAKPRKDASSFAFDDPSGLLEWPANDRGVVVFSSSKDISRNASGLRKLVRAWIEATA